MRAAKAAPAPAAAAATAATTGVSDKTEAQAYLEAFQTAEDQRHRQREFMTPALRNIAYVWIATVVVVILCQGFGSKTGFQLSDKVLLTLITTTTVNVLGLFLIALNYLYPKQDRVMGPGGSKSVSKPKAAKKLSV